MNKNTEYELFVKEIYEILHKVEDVESINIQHDVELTGLTGCKHQLDIYWHFILAGIEYQVAIECKNYSGKVPIGKIRDFNSVLEDIGNINGIFVSKNGFQKGAIEYAKKKGIKLVEIRHPSDKDWEGRMRNLIFTIHAFFTTVKNRSIEIDKEWCAKQDFLKDTDSIQLSGMSDKIFIEDLEKNTTTSIYELENKLPSMEVGTGFKYEYEYKNAYIFDSASPKIKVNKISFEYDVTCATERSEINGDKIAKAIVKNIIEGSEQFIDINGNVKTREIV